MDMLQSPEPSVLDPIGAAIKKTRQILFCPFEAEKWFVLGFCAWLAALGQNGFNFNLRLPGDFSSQPPEIKQLFHDIEVFVTQHLPLVLLIGGGVVVVSIGVGLLVKWLKSRGQFLFVDGIVRNRAAVAEPWRVYRSQGNSLFGFKLLVWLIGAVLSLLMVVPLVAIAITYIQTGFKIFYVGRTVAFFVLMFIFFLFCLAYGLIILLTDDFVVPVMYARRCGVRDAWKACLQLFSAYSGTFFLYLIVLVGASIVLGILSMLVGCFACCCLCCVAWVFLFPLVGGYLFTVLILPLRVWRRSYALLFLAQFGDSFNVFEPTVPCVVPVPDARIVPPVEGENI